jgi:hypothetical protein
MQNNNKADEINKPSQGFLKLMRSPETEELLLNDPLAFALLANIALRARYRTKFDVHGLKFGQALVGDYKEIGFSRQQYRTRLQRLVECGLVTTRPTPRGTIATLASTDVFSINLPLTSGENAKKRPTVLPMKNSARQPTANQQLTNSQPLTKIVRRKEGKNDDNARETVATQRANKKSSSSIWSSSLEEAKNDPLWPQFEAYCISNGGSPTLKGWNTWRPKQSTTSRQHRRASGEITGRSLPIANRNKIINRLNERKQRIMRTFPDGKYEPWAEKDLAAIQRQLKKL